jgi:hypothetical protein
MDVSLLSFDSHTDPADRRPAGLGKTVLTSCEQARRDRIIARALDLGVNLLDVYDSEGQWEPGAQLVQNRRHQVLIPLAHEVSRKISTVPPAYSDIDPGIDPIRLGQQPQKLGQSLEPGGDYPDSGFE